MRRSSKLCLTHCLALAVLLLSAVSTLSLRAAVPSRIAGPIVDAATVTRPGSIHPFVRNATDNGRLNSAAPISNLSLNFIPSAAQQVTLDALLAAQQDPASPSYHQWLTPTQFGAQFGMSAGDLAQVTAWLQSHGFTVERIAPSNNAIHFSGTVDQVGQAFHTELHSLTLNGETHFANTTEPSLPAAFAATVSAIGGLNDFRLRPHLRAGTRQVPYTVSARAGSVTPATTDGYSPPDEYLSPEDFSKIYDVKAMYNAGYSGSASFPIAIVGQSAVRANDITDFRTAFGLTTNPPTLVLVPNTGASAITSTDDLGESELDLEWSGAVAPSAPIYFLYTGNSSTNGSFNYGVFDSLQYVIQTYTVGGKPIPIISISYVECEPSDTAANFATYESWFKQANAQGQTILNSSGDDGAAGCDYSTTVRNSYAATQGLAVSYPASSAYVTGVGGTSFSGDIGSLSTYWATTNDMVYGNELGLYIPSTSWNDTPTTATATTEQGLSASGGGVSTLWPKPSWQTGVTGVPTDGKRDVPDIALSADPNHDGFLTCINLGCEGSGASFAVYGGTSVASPSFAGMLALAEQKLGASQGNLNPALYSFTLNAATYASAFHDITTGNNIVPCVVSATDTGCVGGSMGYSAGTGYDLVTGLGAPDAFNLASALSGVPARINTTETLTSTPSTVLAGQSITFTAVVAPASGSAVPTGTVVFTLDGTPTTVTLTGNSATFTTTITTGGPHTLSAVYSGDANFYGSSATTTLTVTVAATNAATTTTLAASPTAIAIGNTLTLTATVSSTTPGTLTGQVTFTTSAGKSLGPVNLVSSGNTGTATLAIPVALTAFPAGTDTVTATYAGNTTYAPSTSSAATLTVTNPSITLSATNITIAASGGSGSATVTLTSTGGYTGTVQLAAFSISSLNGTYTFSPFSVALAAGGTGTSTFTLRGVTGSSTTGTGILPLNGLRARLGGLALGGGLSFATLLLFGFGSKTRRIRGKYLATLLTAVVFTALTAGLGCSSSSSAVGTTTTTSPTVGTYSVTVTGTDATTSTITGSTTLTVTIQ